MAKSKQDQIDEYATAVGYALHTWSLVEFGLAQLFEALSGINPVRKANAAFFAIVSFETRLDVCHALMPFSSFSRMELEIWDLLYERLRKFYKKRHRLAHFSFVESTTFSRGQRKDTVSLVPFYAANQPKESRLSVKEINERSEKFSELAWAVHWFWQLEMSKQARPPRSKPPATGLARQLHLLAAQNRAKRRAQQQSSGA